MKLSSWNKNKIKTNYMKNNGGLFSPTCSVKSLFFLITLFHYSNHKLKSNVAKSFLIIRQAKTIATGHAHALQPI